MAERAGIAGFVVGAQSENLQFDSCEALETGGNGWWANGDEHFTTTTGFRVGDIQNSSGPKQIGFVDCSAINKKHSGAMDFGFWCAPAAAGPEHQISLKNPKVVGAKAAEISGFAK